MKLSARNKTLAIYAAKCVAGVLLCFPIYMFLNAWVDYTWSLISVILVLSPEGKDALDLALTRIKANFIGAGTGVLILLLHLPSPWNLAAGAIISLFICDRLNLNAGARSTLAAMIIILLHQEGSTGGAHLWDSALSRIVAVVSGCLLGLLITYVFHSIFKFTTPVSASEAPKKEKEREG
ncbi:MAG: FUSC family protein [Cyclobacteriaceae bacterium]|nr:FUSC family protein [Cyclobacteriaceae bacterium]